MGAFGQHRSKYAAFIHAYQMYLELEERIFSKACKLMHHYNYHLQFVTLQNLQVFYLNYNLLCTVLFFTGCFFCDYLSDSHFVVTCCHLLSHTMRHPECVRPLQTHSRRLPSAVPSGRRLRSVRWHRHEPNGLEGIALGRLRHHGHVVGKGCERGGEIWQGEPGVPQERQVPR